MLASVFVDTAAWLALINRSDALHHQAQQVMHELRRQRARLITTEFVLLEVADALAMPPARGRTIAYIDGLRTLTLLEILPATQTLLNEGWGLYTQRPDKAWGWTDCTSFVVMREQGIFQAFTSDHHFEQAGFQRLLIP